MKTRVDIEVNGEKYFVDTPVNEEYFNRHVSQGYIFYEVIDIPYSSTEIKEIENWKKILSKVLQNYTDDESEVIAEAKLKELRGEA